jgi:hypothetical protein
MPGWRESENSRHAAGCVLAAGRRRGQPIDWQASTSISFSTYLFSPSSMTFQFFWDALRSSSSALLSCDSEMSVRSPWPERRMVTM